MSNKRKLEELKRRGEKSSEDVLWFIAQQVAASNDKLSYLLGAIGLGLALLIAMLALLITISVEILGG